MSKRYSARQVAKMERRRDIAGLIDVLGERDEHDRTVSQMAEGALSRIGDRQAIEPILRHLRSIELGSPTRPKELTWGESSRWGSFASALGALAPPGSPAADELLAVVEQRGGLISCSAMEALAEMGDRRAIVPILRRLGIQLSSRDRDWLECETAIESLGTLKAREAAVETLIAALEDEDLRELAAYALGHIGDARAVPTLAALLEPEPPLFIGNAIVVALEQIGTAEAKQAVAAWEERGIRPPDADEWRVSRVPPVSYLPLREWWFKPWWWLAWLIWRLRRRR